MRCGGGVANPPSAAGRQSADDRRFYMHHIAEHSEDKLLVSHVREALRLRTQVRAVLLLQHRHTIGLVW
jgi:hypothetical protein